MKRIEELFEGVKTVAIAGHVNPDGDCVGSCMAMYLYLKERCPEIEADVYLGQMRPVFGHLEGLDQIRQEPLSGKIYDLLLLFDVSSADRIGVAGEYLNTARMTACVDHHITNQGMAKINHVKYRASSTCEVLFELMDPTRITYPVAMALYTGIIHDCGVFQYDNTSPRTMEIGAWLLRQEIPFTRVIEDSFYRKSYDQNRMMGYLLMNSALFLGGRCIAAAATEEEMERFGVSAKDLDGVVNQLRLTEGVEAAVLLYAVGTNQYKVSMRSNGKVDVSKIAAALGGGGHRMAAGCTLDGEPEAITERITDFIAKQLDGETIKK